MNPLTWFNREGKREEFIESEIEVIPAPKESRIEVFATLLCKAIENGELDVSSAEILRERDSIKGFSFPYLGQELRITWSYRVSSFVKNYYLDFAGSTLWGDKDSSISRIYELFSATNQELIDLKKRVEEARTIQDQTLEEAINCLQTEKDRGLKNHP